MGWRRWVAVGVAAGLAVAAGWFVWSAAAGRRDRRERDEARVALKDGRAATARRLLVDLTERRPGDGESLHLLGLSELQLGRPDRAEAAWTRVAADSPMAGWAALHLARLEQERGRLADAETRFLAALGTGGAHRPIARWDFVRLLRLGGRFEEARDVFRAGLAEHPEPAEALRILLKLETDAYPAESAAGQFEEAGRLWPEDDRVWLGRAFVALHAGRLDEAGGWLDRCEAARADDRAVALMRLEWARATDRVEEVRRVLEGMPGGVGDRERALDLKAWLSSKAGDGAAERAALEELIGLAPSRPDVLDRLAQRALADGRVAEAGAYRARRVEREEARRAYVASLSRAVPRDRAAELAGLARAFGRAFDARAWEALAGTEPESVAEREALARVVEDETARRLPVGTTLAALIGPVPAPAPAAEGAGPVVVPRFADAGEATGLGAFVHETGHVEGRLTLPETGAGGVALFDYDGDRRIDVYVVQGGVFPAPADARSADRLFRNRGDGTFEDVSRRAGIAGVRGGYGHGVEAGDFDNDGHVDLFITRWRAYQLLRNRGDGTFEDATEAAGLGGDRDWPTSAAFADLDGDGDLDLYVCHYLKWDEVDDRTCIDPKDPSRYACIPLDFAARPDRLLRNDGGRFVDVSEEAGIVDRDGRGLGVVAADVDEDGRVDLFVANDMTANYLWRNLGGMRFEEVGLASGVGCNAMGGYQAGMGAACGDLDGDGRLDLCVTNYFGESTSFFRNLGDGYFADRTAAIGLTAPSRDRLGFGLALPDVNNDGWLDLLSANGHVHDGRPDFPFAMQAQLLAGIAGGRLRDLTDEAGPPFQRPVLGRGLATGDLDDDGRVDAVLVAQGEPLMVLRNETEGAGGWVRFRLEGVESNRDAIGAVVRVEAGGRAHVAARCGGGSFQSASDGRIHFGIGEADRIERVEVRWPSGRVESFENLEAGRTYHIREGEGGAEAE